MNIPVPRRGASPVPADPTWDRDRERFAARALPLRDVGDLDPLLDRVGDARIVLLGEASHGTAEYYRWRDALTRRLITEQDFDFVAVEGDWPPCQDVDRWVTGSDDSTDDPTEVLEAFRRWPTWMWANREVASFVDWLRTHNRSEDASVGFHGLDVYSLRESLAAVLDYLGDNASDALDAAREAFRCFEPYPDPQQYARATRLIPEDCEEEVIAMLVALRRDVVPADGDRFEAEQNAYVVAGAESYYRTMVGGGPGAWNVRDTHMADTIDRLLDHYGPDAKGVVWEHNSHVGDARHTDMADAGLVNVGQLMRERHGDDVVIVGFAGRRGSVIAATAWGAVPRVMNVPVAPPSTHEDVLRAALAGEPAGVVVFDGSEPDVTVRGHRAIGVVYHPEYEHRGNWVPTALERRYDALCFFDDTGALHPLDVGAGT
ncbi:MAG: erythromycin esterase family protein [Acidimicrobiia bacterium]|nr:erythromycin esterase family protein [Acidimicrobiia bacterium]